MAISDAARRRGSAKAEGLTLLVADHKTGYFGVRLNKRCKTEPYQARVRRGGQQVNLGSFATAEEAALCVARTPEGWAAAERAAAALPLTSEEARQQAQAEGLTLVVADSTTGYFGVYLVHPGHPKPYQAQMRRGGKMVHLGSFATVEEAALCIARTPEGQKTAKTAAAAVPPLTSDEARQQAQAEGLTLRVAGNKTSYYGLSHELKSKTNPYRAQVRRGDEMVHLGCFATAEEAALCTVRSPEGKAAAQKAAAATRPLTSEEEGKGSFVKEEGTVPAMPPDAFIKVEIVVKEEEGRPKRPKTR